MIRSWDLNCKDVALIGYGWPPNHCSEVSTAIIIFILIGNAMYRYGNTVIKFVVVVERKWQYCEVKITGPSNVPR